MILMHPLSASVNVHQGLFVCQRDQCLTIFLCPMSQKDIGRGRGDAEDERQHRTRRRHYDEASSVSEGRVLVVCSDLCTASNLDLQSGL